MANRNLHLSKSLLPLLVSVLVILVVGYGLMYFNPKKPFAEPQWKDPNLYGADKLYNQISRDVRNEYKTVSGKVKGFYGDVQRDVKRGYRDTYRGADTFFRKDLPYYANPTNWF